MYRKVLVPMENSVADETILEHIRPLARLCGSQLVLVHVADGFVARNQEQLNLADSEEMTADRAYLERRKRELASEGFSVSAHLLCGEPSREIAKFAESEGCDLIAMCTHGHRFVQDLLLGSVTHEVRHRVRVPVLLVRQKA
ncbi:MAG: universal stress protein [Phycisphaerales bacterium]